MSRNTPTVLLRNPYVAASPTRGQVWGSGRRAQNRIVTVMTTLSFYVFTGIWAALLFFAKSAKP